MFQKTSKCGQYIVQLYVSYYVATAQKKKKLLV